ncbi:hypothetical protein ACT80S_05170 [Ramlibacter sp. MAHUQ-53]|uniref:hypothetical protein n=1 Tax=unclassified Ramlibacter TaxID=2617605 RepID=UPI003644B951
MIHGATFKVQELVSQHVQTDFKDSPVGRFGEHSIAQAPAAAPRATGFSLSALASAIKRLFSSAPAPVPRAEASARATAMEASRHAGDLLGAISRTDTVAVQGIPASVGALMDACAKLGGGGTSPSAEPSPGLALGIAAQRIGIHVRNMSSEQLDSLMLGLSRHLAAPDPSPEIAAVMAQVRQEATDRVASSAYKTLASLPASPGPERNTQLARLGADLGRLVRVPTEGASVPRFNLPAMSPADLAHVARGMGPGLPALASRADVLPANLQLACSAQALVEALSPVQGHAPKNAAVSAAASRLGELAPMSTGEGGAADAISTINARLGIQIAALTMREARTLHMGLSGWSASADTTPTIQNTVDLARISLREQVQGKAEAATQAWQAAKDAGGARAKDAATRELGQCLALQAMVDPGATLDAGVAARMDLSDVGALAEGGDKELFALGSITQVILEKIDTEASECSLLTTERFAEALQANVDNTTSEELVPNQLGLASGRTDGAILPITVAMAKDCQRSQVFGRGADGARFKLDFKTDMEAACESLLTRVAQGNRELALAASKLTYQGVFALLGADLPDEGAGAQAIPREDSPFAYDGGFALLGSPVAPCDFEIASDGAGGVTVRGRLAILVAKSATVMAVRDDGGGSRKFDQDATKALVGLDPLTSRSYQSFEARLTPREGGGFTVAVTTPPKASLRVAFPE